MLDSLQVAKYFVNTDVFSPHDNGPALGEPCFSWNRLIVITRIMVGEEKKKKKKPSLWEDCLEASTIKDDASESRISGPLSFSFQLQNFVFSLLFAPPQSSSRSFISGSLRPTQVTSAARFTSSFQISWCAEAPALHGQYIYQFKRSTVRDRRSAALSIWQLKEKWRTIRFQLVFFFSLFLT